MNSSARHSGRWVGFRKELKVLDCTIRDGGLMNSSRFDDKTVRAVYDACADAGIDYMEIGYKNSKKIYSPAKFGDWRFSDEDSIKRIIGDNKRDIKISVMADAEKSDYKTELGPKADSNIDMVRIATYIHQIPLAMDMIKHCTDMGYETTVNIMAGFDGSRKRTRRGSRTSRRKRCRHDISCRQFRLTVQRANPLHDGEIHENRP